MSAQAVFSSYQSVQIGTAGRERLLIMLYEGCIRFLEQGRTAVAAGRREEGHNALLRAQDIIAELMSTLDMEAGGQVARNLYRLYEYYTFLLVDANLHQNVAPIAEVIDHMQQLLDAWHQVIRQSASAQGGISRAA